MSDLIVSDDGPIRTLRMNRPAKKNALTLAMYDAMAAAVEDSGTNGAIRCLLIAGGPESFCAGNDIGDFMKAADEGRCHGDPLKLVVVPDHETVKAMAAIDVVAVHQQNSEQPCERMCPKVTGSNVLVLRGPTAQATGNSALD